ncbi:rCG61286, isoform CRA_b [Rattus norvegicus]|uniref:RCG61286, isoform CRA_b n=1 Tax=Rattus norvegicus TaxID=10116 RepID=A6KEB5_RAT|nr:rCG61286, isoform CRA_b [Rattus norvegicus]
MASSSNEIP